MAVGAKPVAKPPAPSSAITCLTPPIKPLLYLIGSSWILVLTTSTGHMAAWVTLQQIPPAKAALVKYSKLNLAQGSADILNKGKKKNLNFY